MTVSVVGVVLAVTGLLGRCSGLVESWTFYWPTPGGFAAPPGAEDVWFEGRAGRLHGWWLGVPEGVEREGVVLFCHGNADSLPSHHSFVRFLPDMGFAVFMFDYRGYGRSERGGGRLLREKLIEDAHAAHGALLGREGVEPGRVVLMGHSMGAMAASNLAADLVADGQRVNALAMVSAFSSFPAVASDHAGVVGRWLVADGRAPEEAVASLGQTPVLLMHGTTDPVVPARHAPINEASGKKTGVPVELLLVEDADHVSVLVSCEGQSRVAAFFRRALDPGD